MNTKIKQLVAAMTTEEKASLCSGESFWMTKSINRLDIPSIMLTDGPHGLRKQAGDSDHLGLNASVPATCFPTAAGLASSWDRDLIRRLGEALGRECQAEGVDILLGPGANIKRSPLCGRNFEYFSEDPYLTGELAAAHIEGVQSQGVGTSLKHFAVNNQEHRRMTTDAIVDERTLREIYLTGFEIAVKKSQPWTVMSAYNRLNGTYCSENEKLLTGILKEEWGHEGIVVSDWGAVNEAVDSVAAGMELEMPSSSGISQSKIANAVESGKLSIEALDRAVIRLLTVIFKAVDNRKTGTNYDKEEHHQLAREIARDSMVLLKNDDNLLPLNKTGKLAIIGAMAEQVRYQGGGSSHINPTKLDNIKDEIGKSAAGAEIMYSKGYLIEADESVQDLLNEAKQAAAASDTAILFVGLPDRYESEGYDRTHLNLPANQIELIEQIATVQSNIVVVLSNGSPIVMPWLGNVKAVLEAYLGGQALGGAIADLLFGDANPSGKLAETFPQNLKHSPAHPFFPGEEDRTEYREGVFVGYRYYEAKDIHPLFPFGHGLSYTTFAYSGIDLVKNEITDQDTVQVSVIVKNTGVLFGKEIVQLYVKSRHSSVIRPEKELKGFVKVALEPGEEKRVTFTLDKRSFAFYNTNIKDWHAETGEYEIAVGSSSREIALRAVLKLHSTTEIIPAFHRNTTIGELMGNAKTLPILAHLQSMAPSSATPSDAVSPEMMAASMKYLPLRALLSFSGGAMTEDTLGMLVEQFNQAVQSEQGKQERQHKSGGDHMSYNENSKLGDLLANDAAVAVLEKHLPGISTNPMASMGKGLSLKQLSAIPQANMPQELIAAIVADLAGLGVQDAGTVSGAKTDTSNNLGLMVPNGSVAVITGAGSGIGRAASLKLSRAGYKIVAVDFNAATGEETLALIREQGGEGIFVQADVSNNDDVERYVNTAVETYGRIDAFFNNAGVLQKFSMLENIELAEYERIMNVNVRGVFLGLKHVLKVMAKQGFGSVINTASTAGLRAEHSMAAYTASKHAVIGLTKAAAIEYVRKGVRINAICPGGVDTALTQAVPAMMQDSGYTPEEFPNMRIGRFAEPAELAEMVVFLASGSSSYMTGSIVAVDGGLTL